ncbi:hypothetical protein DAPPUDRAFT_313948 [Daphnia pulex]|uniref:LRRNT domain-containing protein n=1 Tax=Daphnia pulex TaxID=6669 RepID=E9G4A3_DAPPU|nr:hypothetical protein DAPPUDRAFT_313948 [Daphnia pulex]|eukprot:EFX85259.1 hypothetical protein DAPPUDRAFT_313948 [Daphnia pulex]
MQLTGTVHHPNTVVTVPFFLLLILSSIGRTDAVDCGNCFCSADVVTGYQNVICLGVPFTEIQNTFTGNTGFVNINRFDIVPKIGDTQIPAGLLGLHKARIIHLASCGNNLMEIDRNAFQSSATTMEEFVVYDCNVASLVWTFLDSFTRVNLLQLEGAINIQSLGTLPSLLSLKRISITDCKGFSSLNFPGSSLGGLQNLIMTENAELTDGKAESILATLNGASKLEMVSLKNNPSISRIPNTLANLVALHSLDVSLCDINSISSGSLSFSTDVKLLDLTKSSLSDISDDSFEKGV